MDPYFLFAEEGREEHIARHGIRLDEAEEVVRGRPFVRKTRDRETGDVRYRFIGQTREGRYLLIICAPRHGIIMSLGAQIISK